MAAQNTDKLRKVARKWVGQVGAGGVESGTVTTVPLASTANLPTETAIMITIDRVDANGVLTPDKEEGIIGVVSGDNLISCIRGVEGTAQAHSAGAVVEVLWTAKNVNDIVDAILAEHSQSGAHTTDTISEKTEDAGVTVDGLKIKDGRIAGWDGWSELTTLTRVSDTTAILSGDWTDRLQKGDKLWWKSNGVSRYNYIIGVSYSAPTTTITITGGYKSTANDSRFENGETITEPRYSKVENPQGFPNNFNFLPTEWARVDDGSGGSPTLYVAQFSIHGRCVHVEIFFNTAYINYAAGSPYIGFNAAQLPYPANNDSRSILGACYLGTSIGRTYNSGQWYYLFIVDSIADNTNLNRSGTTFSYTLR